MSELTGETLREALASLLSNAGWTQSGGRTFRRADMRLSLGYREIHLDETGLPEGPIEVLHVVVSSVDQAIGHLRLAGVLPEEADAKEVHLALALLVTLAQEATAEAQTFGPAMEALADAVADEDLTKQAVDIITTYVHRTDGAR